MKLERGKRHRLFYAKDWNPKGFHDIRMLRNAIEFGKIDTAYFPKLNTSVDGVIGSKSVGR